MKPKQEALPVHAHTRTHPEMNMVVLYRMQQGLKAKVVRCKRAHRCRCHVSECVLIQCTSEKLNIFETMTTGCVFWCQLSFMCFTYTSRAEKVELAKLPALQKKLRTRLQKPNTNKHSGKSSFGRRSLTTAQSNYPSFNVRHAQNKLKFCSSVLGAN